MWVTAHYRGGICYEATRARHEQQQACGAKHEVVGACWIAARCRTRSVFNGVQGIGAPRRSAKRPLGYGLKERWHP